jgi:hypothetical protein
MSENAPESTSCGRLDADHVTVTLQILKLQLDRHLGLEQRVQDCGHTQSLSKDLESHNKQEAGCLCTYCQQCKTRR